MLGKSAFVAVVAFATQLSGASTTAEVAVRTLPAAVYTVAEGVADGRAVRDRVTRANTSLSRP